jgi:hypothetical protein
MNNEQQEILNEVYENYESRQINMYIPIWSQEEFINKCKTDSEFSEKWGLQIKERELSEEERWRIRFDYYPKDKQFPWDRMALPSHRFLDDFNIPRKQITITYNDKTIESYE